MSPRQRECQWLWFEARRDGDRLRAQVGSALVPLRGLDQAQAALSEAVKGPTSGSATAANRPEDGAASALPVAEQCQQCVTCGRFERVFGQPTCRANGEPHLLQVIFTTR